MENFKAGFVAVIGRPNTGKSTLVNALVGTKIVITSHHPNTTRNPIRGIVNRDDFQMILVDTPGMHKPKTALGTRLNSMVTENISSTDSVLLCLPANEEIGAGDEYIAKQIKNGQPLFLVVTKVDAVSKSDLAVKLTQVGDFANKLNLNRAEIVPVSAKNLEQTQLLLELLAKNLPMSPALYPKDINTDQAEELMYADLIREAILKVHLKKITTGPDVNPKVIARGTPGFSGADLANIVNESALLAARRNKRIVTMSDLEEAKDKVMMGAERKSMVMTEEEKTLTAYHEGGHAVVALYEPTSDPIHKATIIPRGRALGMVMRLPERDQLSITREKMFGNISVAMGGRIAEEMIFGYDNVTSGASSDIEMVTKMAKNMVTRYGMSDQLGPIAYQENEEEVFLGRSVSRTQNVSEETAKKIDFEVKKIVEAGYARAKKILAEKVDELHKVSKALLTYETLSGEEIKKIVFENVYPKRLSGKEEASTTKKNLGSALGAIGLKPNTQS